VSPSLPAQTRERKAKRLQRTERIPEITVIESIFHFAQLHQNLVRIGLVNNLKVVLGTELGATVIIQHELSQRMVVMRLPVLEHDRDLVSLQIGRAIQQASAARDFPWLTNHLLVLNRQNLATRHQVIVLQLQLPLLA